jgi:1,4-dihydroxy-2-naphthoate octaprenyltransferase
MNDKKKTTLRWVFIAAVMCWALTSSARAGQWERFLLNLGAIFFAMLVGLLVNLFTGKTRKRIVKNMTSDERTHLARIGEQAGKRLGIRVIPFAFLSTFLSMLFGMPSLIYTVPPSIILLAVLCRPVWRETREQTNAMLLATAFAQENGIKTLRGTANQQRHATR